MIGPARDIPAPDMYTNATIMGWMADEYYETVRKKVPGVITGKPVHLGGSLGREAATGQGIVCPGQMGRTPQPGGQEPPHRGPGIWQCRLPFCEPGPQVGILHRRGFGFQGSHICGHGLNPDVLMAQKREHRELTRMEYCATFVCETTEYKVISNRELLELEVDVLALAALENQVTAQNAGWIQARHLLEIANGPVDSQGDEVLFKRGITVLPNVLVNSGGVTVSYFEWLQNRAGLYWEEIEVNWRLKKTMDGEADCIFDTAEEQNISLRTAATCME